MFRASLLFACLAAPVHAQAPCGGIADVLGELFTAGFIAVSTGQTEGGTFTVFTHEGGRFLVVFFSGEAACIVAAGTDWQAVKPNA